MKFKKSFIYILAGTALLSACSKKLDISPTDSINETNAFQTIGDVQLGVNGAYGRYSNYANDMYFNALLSDEAKLGANNAGQGALTYRYQFSSDATTGGDVVGAYVGWYLLIDQCNRVLPNIDKVTGGSAERKAKARGELLALRGLAHFELLQAYSNRYNPSDPLGVAVITEVNPLALPARKTMGEVMAQVEKDISDAKALLPAVTAATFSDTVMNQINLTAYQARIALYKGDYQAAINYATTVINSGIKPLVTGTAFNEIWTDKNSNEILFKIRYETSAGLGSLWTTTGGDIYIAPSDKLVASYGAGDIRRAAFIGTTNGANYVNKFYTSDRGGRVVHMKACRTAEMYLIRAEANAKLSTPNITAGAADLNTLRAQRITGYTPATFATAADLVTAVLTERFKELCFEGFRFFDLKRNNLPVQRNASDANPDWQNLSASSFRFILPIPRDALNANPNIKQNPGYN
jgi:starch-binding outer membrane protein, SusD/RagB family